MLSSERPQRFVVVLVAGMSIFGFSAGCNSSPSMTSGERAVCDAVQSLMDNISKGAGFDSLGDLDRISVAGNNAGDGVIGRQARDLIASQDQRIDESTVTVEQVQRLAQAALDRGASSLQQIIDGCRVGGRPIVNLPKPPASTTVPGVATSIPPGGAK